jgi:hypothetical protein
MADLETVEDWAGALQVMGSRIGARFERAEPRQRAIAYLRGLMSDVPRKNGWQLAEQAAALLAHNALRFGDPLATGYAGEAFSTPPWAGIGGLLFSPGKGLWLHAPPLVLSALLWLRFRRAHPPLAGFLALAWALALPFYGMWWAWDGGWAWGPRLLVPLLPLSCLPLLALPARRGWWAAAGCALALGVAVNALGILSNPATLHAQAAAGCVAWTLHDIPLAGATRLLADGHSEPLALFHLTESGLPRTWSVGAPALLSGGLIAGIWRMARAARPRS